MLHLRVIKITVEELGACEKRTEECLIMIYAKHSLQDLQQC